MPNTVKSQLTSYFTPALVYELLSTYSEAKRNFYLGGHRLAEVEGGRFCEAAFRMLEETTEGKYTPLGHNLDTDRTINRLANFPKGRFPDSVRLHIPRALRLVYDIRNQRDAAHLADGIDPNLQDATVVTSTLDWIMAEFVRLYHKVSATEAQRIVEDLVTRAAPVVQDFDGFPKVLNPHLKVSEYCLVLLYHRSSNGATFDQMRSWVRPAMRQNLARTLSQLVNEKDYLHVDGNVYRITRRGELEVEKRGLLEPR